MTYCDHLVMTFLFPRNCSTARRAALQTTHNYPSLLPPVFLPPSPLPLPSSLFSSTFPPSLPPSFLPLPLPSFIIFSPPSYKSPRQLLTGCVCHKVPRALGTVRVRFKVWMTVTASPIVIQIICQLQLLCQYFEIY